MALGQRIIQGALDIFLVGSLQDGVDFYVRQLRDMQGGAAFMPGKTKVSDFSEYCSLRRWTLAREH